jgi:predicted PurR-regulated permease PerM
MLLIIFGWLAFTVIVAVAANTRGRNAFGWGILAALFSPLIAGLLLLALPNRRMEALLSGKPFGPTPEQLKRRQSIAAVVVSVLFVLVVIGVLISKITDQSRQAVAKTGESSVVRTIEENGKPVQNAAVKKNR